MIYFVQYITNFNYTFDNYRKASFVSNSAVVEYIDGKINIEDIIDEIEDMGYEATKQSARVIKPRKPVIPQQISNDKKATIAIDGILHYKHNIYFRYFVVWSYVFIKLEHIN